MESSDEIVLVQPPELCQEPAEQSAGDLSTRELFAAMALQGILSGRKPEVSYDPEETAQVAIAFADALLTALHR
jgi:hypothetical protein